jgi:hypothetical protein
MAGFRTPRSTAHIEFRSPPTFLPLSGGGGGPESRVQLFNSRDHSARINGARGDSGPPPLAFLPLSGGGGFRIQGASFRRLRLKRPDQWRVGDLDLFLLSAFNQRGPFPVMSACGPSSLLPSVLLLAMMRLAPSSPSSSFDTRPLPLFWSMWPLPPISLSTHHLCHVSCSLRLLSSAICLPLPPLSHLIASYFTPAVLAPPLLFCTPSFVLASTPMHQITQLIQVAAHRAFHVLKVPSWPGLPQSQ